MTLAADPSPVEKAEHFLAEVGESDRISAPQVPAARAAAVLPMASSADLADWGEAASGPVAAADETRRPARAVAAGDPEAAGTARAAPPAVARPRAAPVVAVARLAHHHAALAAVVVLLPAVVAHLADAEASAASPRRPVQRAAAYLPPHH